MNTIFFSMIIEDLSKDISNPSLSRYLNNVKRAKERVLQAKQEQVLSPENAQEMHNQRI